MVFNNNMRPAMAGYAPEKSDRARQNDHLSFMNGGDTEDFNAFHSQPAREAGAKNPQRRPQQQPPKKKLNKGLIVGIAAGAAVVLVAVIIVIALMAGGGSIKYEDNAYIAYADSDAVYHVSVNGVEVDHTFEGEVEVVPAADNSFAYVTDMTAEGTYIYLLDGKDLVDLSGEAVSEVLALASLKPGVVFKTQNNKIYHYSEKYGECPVTKNKDLSAANFQISGDATTVTYTTAVDNSAGELQLWLFVAADGISEKIAKNLTPDYVSSYGDYIYAHTKDQGTLYIITTSDYEKYPVESSSGFTSIISANVKGDELIFTTTKDATIATYLYYYDMDESTSIRLGKGVLTPAVVDSSIALPKTFADSYFTGVSFGTEDLISYATYYLSSGYEADSLVSAAGKFSPDGDYLYYVNDEGGLTQYDLRDGTEVDVYRDDDVLDFVITEKGNVYILNQENTLFIYKLSEGKYVRVPSVKGEVMSMSLHNYANELYFSMADDFAEETVIYTTEEGSEKEIAKIGSAQPTSVPSFSNPNGKKTYAYYYDVDNGWMIYYTSGGKSFKQITSDCQAINGITLEDSFG